MKKLRIISFLTSSILMLALFHAAGNASFVEDHGRSLFAWLYNTWTSDLPGIDYSHGPLVLLFCFYLIYRDRQKLRNISDEIYTPAVILLALAFFVHFIGLRIQYTSVSALGFALAVFSMAVAYLGRESAKHLVFPCTFFLFAVPWPLISNASFPLRVLATRATEAVLNGLAVPIITQWTAIIVSREPLLALEVADPCSGLRSLMALSALAAGWAFISELPRWVKCLFFFSAIPIAIIANICRIVSVVLLSFVLKTETTLAFYHDSSGYMVFVVAVLLMIGESAAIGKLMPSERKT